MDIFNIWFKEGKYNQNLFFSQYNEIIINEKVEEEYSKHKKWRLETKLSATPTILKNGFELPDIYKVEELEYFTGLYDIKNHC